MEDDDSIIDILTDENTKCDLINYGEIMYENINKKLKEKFNDQDFMQRLTVLFSSFVGFYSIIMSSLLLIFVPQSCNVLCTDFSRKIQNSEIINCCVYNNNYMYQFINGVFVINFITLLLFIIMYIIELIRENKLIKYLNVNINMPNDNLDVEKTFKKLLTIKIMEIHNIDKYYQISSYTVMFFFIINAILSGIIIYNNYRNNQTATSFITNIMLMSLKLTNVYKIINTEKNIFYSAYMTSSVQFNDVDKKYKKQIRKIKKNVETIRQVNRLNP